MNISISPYIVHGVLLIKAVRKGGFLLEKGEVDENLLLIRWNNGFNLGKLGFVAQQTFNDTCKRKK